MALLESPFNYRYGEIYEQEGTLTYTKSGFEAYANSGLAPASESKPRNTANVAASTGVAR